MPRRRDNGQGGITKRADGRWQGSYPDGQGRRRYVYGQTKRAVQEKLAELITLKNQGIILEPGRETVGSFARQWLDDVKAHDVELQSLYSYTDRLKHVTAALGNVPLRQLQGRQLQHLYSELLEGGMSANHVRGIHVVVHSMLRQALKWNLVLRNEAEAATPPKASPFAPTVLGPEDMRALLAAEGRLRPMMTVALTTGMRLGELRALRWEEVRLDQAELQVTRNLIRVRGGGWQVKEPKSKRGKRAIALGATAVSVLTTHRQQQRLERMVAGARWQDNGLVFASQVGTPLMENTIQIGFNRMLKAAEIEHIRFHDLRHTHATTLLLAGVPVHVVAARLGDDPVTILGRYAHLLPSSQQIAVDKFEAVIGL